MKFNRRQFIKITGATAGATMVGSGLTTNLWGMDPNDKYNPGTDGDQVIPSICEMCFWKCGIKAHVKKGRITKIEGNPKHPLSRGLLCPRGTGGAGLAHDPDRLTDPLIRVEKGGVQSYEKVSWDAALDLVAENLMKIRQKHGPEALALYTHGFGASWYTHLFKAYGTAAISHPSYAQCRGSRQEAFELTYGAPAGSPEVLDIENSRVLTLIGSHLGENMHNTQVQDFARAIEKGAQIIVVDPRFSTAASKAKHWLPIKPGTDIALLLAWMHVIINEGLYDHKFVEENTHGFEQLKAHVADKTPQWAFGITTIRPEKIVETARLIAGGQPRSLIHPGRRAAWYGNDTQRGRAIAIMNALVGSWGRRGGFFIPNKMSLPKYKSPAYTHKPKLPPDQYGDKVYPFAHHVLSHGIRDASIPGTADYDIKSWFVYGSNLMRSIPEPQKTLEALQNLDFVTVVDVLPMEITGFADVVLPEASYLERYDDIHGPGWREPFLAIRQPVVKPPGQAKSPWWIAKELAGRMGYGDYFAFDGIEQYLEKRLSDGGYSFADLKRDGVILGKEEPLYYEDGIEPEFHTPSGKIELYSDQMAEAGVDPMPVYYPIEEPGPGEFRLLTGRVPMHSFGRTTNNRLLSRVYEENEVWVNAKMAKELGFKTGDRVTLTNQDDVKSLPVKLVATQRIRPDAVYMAHGFGHADARLRFGHKKGASSGELTTKTKLDPVMGGTGLLVTFVRIEKFEEVHA